MFGPVSARPSNISRGPGRRTGIASSRASRPVTASRLPRGKRAVFGGGPRFLQQMPHARRNRLSCSGVVFNRTKRRSQIGEAHFASANAKVRSGHLRQSINLSVTDGLPSFAEGQCPARTIGSSTPTSGPIRAVAGTDGSCQCTKSLRDSLLRRAACLQTR